jgi:hypothetical protein
VSPVDIAKEDVKLKIEAEKRLVAALDVLVASSAYSIDYTGDPPEQITQALRTLLESHYYAVLDDFKGNLRTRLGDLGISDRAVDEFIVGTLQDRIYTHSIESAAPIIATAIALIESYLGAGATAREAARKLAEHMKSVAQTETNWIAEAVKQQEAIAIETLAEAEYEAGRKPLPGKFKKMWVGILDSDIRLTHLKADGQVVGSRETFTVGGFPMMHPGDMTRGAPLREVVNCRCTAVFALNFS